MQREKGSWDGIESEDAERSEGNRKAPLKRQFLQEPQGVTFQKTAFFRVTAVKTSNLT
jgi:hypothetical protein